jgi:hypothetical protein
LRGRVLSFPSDGIEFVLEKGGEVFAFGEVLARQAVGIFIDAALPGTMGVSEVDLMWVGSANRSCWALSRPWS